MLSLGIVLRSVSFSLPLFLLPPESSVGTGVGFCFRSSLSYEYVRATSLSDDTCDEISVISHEFLSLFQSLTI